jgi:hypothetical protein
MAGKKPERVYVFKGQGQGSLFSVVNEASPALRELAERFPEYLSRALSSLGFQIKQEISRTIRDGGVPGKRWEKLSAIRQHRRIKDDLAMDRLPRRKRGEGPRESKEGVFQRWSSQPGEQRATDYLGKVQKAVQLVDKTKSDTVIVGALGRASEQELDRFQTGLRTKITPKMRRTLWGAGIPTDLAELVQEPRPLIDAVYSRMRPYFEPILMQRLQGYIEGKSGRQIGDYKLPWR